MKVLVTGADGFIGSHLTEKLVKEGYSVKALAQYNSFNSWGWLENISCINDVEVITGDIRDQAFCRNLVNDVETVFHLAALIAIPYSYVSPESYFETNVKGTMNICQAVLSKDNLKLIHTSTSEVYGSAKYVPIDEKHPFQPQSPYSASKIAADALASSFFSSFNLPLIIARPFNTYGPRQSARAVIPSVITQIASGKKEISIGDVSPTRDFNYVSDTCNGLLLCSTLDFEKIAGETFNIGSGNETSIEETILLIKDIMSSDVEFKIENRRIRPRKSEVYRLLSDNKKLKAISNYAPSVSLKAGLTKTIDWFLNQENLKNYKTDIYNV